MSGVKSRDGTKLLFDKTKVRHKSQVRSKSETLSLSSKQVTPLTKFNAMSKKNEQFYLFLFSNKLVLCNRNDVISEPNV